MKTIIFLFSAFCLMTLFICCHKDDSGDPSPSGTDSFRVSVTNGYGGGTYRVGDTVHIFSEAFTDSQLFSAWTGSDISLLNMPNEWHTWFVMPKKNVSFSGNTIAIPASTLKFENIMGKERMKPVYYHFPSKIKGVVYLLHGTNGNASNLANGSYEWHLLIKNLIDDHYGVIITEAEESTTGKDLNGDGKIRWNNLPWDTAKNVDFANIRILTDTFINRGLIAKNIPRYSIGMSNGGNFSTALATIYHFKAAVSYCAPSGQQIAQITSTPIQFCMARFDQNPSVGPTGNANALEDSQILTSRGICSKYLIKERSPLYPERFARDGSISLDQSREIFNEIKSNGFLDNRNYFKGTADDFRAAFQANPSAYPVIRGLSTHQQLFITEQISLAVSDHHIYSDFDKATIKFLDDPCH
jgi:hypothetical protein